MSSRLSAIRAPLLACVVIGVIPGGRLDAQPNTLSPKERAEGWQLLFDGKTLHGWRGLGYDSIPTAHWKVDAGTIHKIPNGAIPRLPDGQPAAGGDLMTIATFAD